MQEDLIESPKIKKISVRLIYLNVRFNFMVSDLFFAEIFGLNFEKLTNNGQTYSKIGVIRLSWCKNQT